MYKISFIKHSGDILVKKTLFGRKKDTCFEDKEKVTIYVSNDPNKNISKYISTLKNYGN